MNLFDYSEFVKSKCKSGDDILATLDGNKAHLAHMTFGVMDEVGELTSPLKKHIFYEQELDIENVKEELGDLLFYLFGIISNLDLDVNEILAYNRDKLNKRYSKGYSNKEALDRKDKNA